MFFRRLLFKPSPPPFTSLLYDYVILEVIANFWDLAYLCCIIFFAANPLECNVIYIKMIGLLAWGFKICNLFLVSSSFSQYIMSRGLPFSYWDGASLIRLHKHFLQSLQPILMHTSLLLQIWNCSRDEGNEPCIYHIFISHYVNGFAIPFLMKIFWT